MTDTHYLHYFGQEGLYLPAGHWQVVILSNQLSINIRKRVSWDYQWYRLGIVCYIEGASSYK